MTDDKMFESRRDADGDAPAGLLQFACPRCQTATEATYWGPCPGCRDKLAATLRREAREVEVGAYEPKMNVVPNQVATKD